MPATGLWKSSPTRRSLPCVTSSSQNHEAVEEIAARASGNGALDDVPTLFLHGDDDQIVPIVDSAMLAAKLVKKATLKVYPGAPHGMCTTLAD